ncbi:hypothetical protein ACPV5U_24515 [Vibrio mediterranei]
MKQTLILALVLGVVTPPTSATYLASLQVEKTQVINPEIGQSAFKYLVDDIEIEMSEKDRHLAKNWNLTQEDWAKYLYIMEYTPRGLWTPDLDPPIALGNYARTEEERLYYVKIMNSLEENRRKRELALEATSIRHIKSTLAGAQQSQQSGMAAKLTENRDTLRSVFIDLKNCNNDCKIFVTMAIATSPASTKLDIHFTNAKPSEANRFLKDIGITDERREAKAISVNAAPINAAVLRFSNGGKLPYYIIKNDEIEKRVHIQ